MRARVSAAVGLPSPPPPAWAEALAGEADRQPMNWTAIAMFAAFVILTLWITRWAAKRTRTAASFYTAGGGITALGVRLTAIYVGGATRDFDALLEALLAGEGE